MERLWGSLTGADEGAGSSSRDTPAGSGVLRARSAPDPSSAPVVGTRFSRFMQLPSRMDLTSDELRRANDEGPRRTASGRSLHDAAEQRRGAQSFASMDAYAPSDAADESENEGADVAGGPPPPGSRFPPSRSDAALAAAAINAGTSRAAAAQARAAAVGQGDEVAETTVSDWLARVWRRMC